jgi:hypothetical protein
MKILLSSILVLLMGSLVLAQDANKNWFQVYGHVMTDMGYNANQIQPDWYDVVRPTKLPTMKNQYGTDGNVFFGVRQTRLGVKTSTQTSMGELFTQFEFELFGTGVDAGQTTFRLRHAYGELGQFGVGQTWSPFMDIDVFPNSLEYWGPNGMVFFRNIQVRWMPIKGDTRLTLALERPGASGDQGVYSEIIEQRNVNINSKFPLPDFSAEYRSAHDWGYVELAGIVRYIKWVDNTVYEENENIDLSGDALGWGLNLSSNLKFSKNDVLRLSFVYGEGIQNYMNDAPVDIAIQNNAANDPTKPIKGVPLPMYSAVAFLDHTWNEKFSTAIGYSILNIDNSDGQNYDAFHIGQYALVDLCYYPVANVMMGAEVQWGSRENFNNLEVNDVYPTDYLKTADIIKVQFSFKYNFSHKMLF